MPTQRFLGVELGSTRIKAVTLDENHQPVSSGDYLWQSRYENSLWTYDLQDALAGLRAAVSQIRQPELVTAAGISGMMHGYLAFDKDWNLLTPFRSWQNTCTAQAAETLTSLFAFNIPQRWSIAHLYQAVLNNEPHVSQVAHITTLSGYIHYRLTGVNAVGIGEASGMFPVDSRTLDYRQDFLDLFDSLIPHLPFTARQVLPKVLTAGETAGMLTEEGAKLLGNVLPAGIPFAPPEGDGGTGMVATNAVAPRTGNVSAGTSLFTLAVLEKPLSRVYPEIAVVATPVGLPVALVHANNCTNDMNAWIHMFEEVLALFGVQVPADQLFTKLYQRTLEGDANCGNVLVYNYLTGETATHVDEGRPMVLRTPESRFTLANFLRAQLYATMSTLRIGMDLLGKEQVAMDRLTGHGGLFKTPGVGQRYLAAACNTPITCMQTAGEGGPYGMALLASYMTNHQPGESLADFLQNKVFCHAESTTLYPRQEDVEGFNRFLESYIRALPAEKTAIEVL